MGGGNPESADAVIARGSQIFIADKLSQTNKNQLDSLNIQWVELRSDDGFKKFSTILEELEIPHQKLKISSEGISDDIFKKIFS